MLNTHAKKLILENVLWDLNQIAGLNEAGAELRRKPTEVSRSTQLLTGEA